MDQPVNSVSRPAGASPRGRTGRTGRAGWAAQVHNQDMDPAVAAAAAGRAFLALLSREAPAVEFEGPLLEARAAGMPPAVLAQLEEAKLLGLRIRGELEQHRRREAELAALFETAGDLAALHDLDSVLRAIARRARSLLGTDVAYMTLHDVAAGDTYMRVTDGSVSERFRAVRLGMGEGLGGLVAQKRAPYAAEDYMADRSLLHTTAIDAAVRDEGLVAILGVPMLLGGSVIGVLFAADRRPRAFSRAEVSLLCSMAAHAAIAIDSANLLEETRSALAELNRVNELVRRHSAEVERASDAHDRFTELVLQGGNVGDVAQAVGEVLSRDVIILGEQDSLLAVSGEELETAGDPPVPTDLELLRAVVEAGVRGRAVHAAGCWAAAALAGSQRLGAVVVRAGRGLAEADVRIIERAAMVTALLLLQRRSVAEAEQRVRGELLNDLLGGLHTDSGSLRDRAVRLGANLDLPHVVIAAAGAHPQDPGLLQAAIHLAATRHGLACAYDEVTVLMLPGAGPSEMVRAVRAELSLATRQQVTAGAAPAGPDPAAVTAAYLQARRCLDALRALGRCGKGATAEELGFVGLLLSERKDVPGFIRATIGRLIEYDERKHTELVRTTAAYFAAGGNLTRAKQVLHIHVNTVTQRVERITSLLGDGWQEGERALEIQLALYLHQLGGWPPAAAEPPARRGAGQRCGVADGVSQNRSR